MPIKAHSYSATDTETSHILRLRTHLMPRDWSRRQNLCSVDTLMIAKVHTKELHASPLFLFFFALYRCLKSAKR